MPIITPEPIFLSDCDLSVASDDFAAACSKITLTPSSSIQTFQGMKPSATFAASTSPTWQLDMSYIQDWASAKSLSQYLMTNAGTVKEFTFKPKTGGKGWKVNVLVQPGPIGGDVNTHANASVSLGCQGAPVAVAAA